MISMLLSPLINVNLIVMLVKNSDLDLHCFQKGVHTFEKISTVHVTCYSYLHKIR